MPLRTAIWTVVTLLCLPIASSAQPDKTPIARALANKGARHFNRGEYDQAISAFEEAYKFKPHFMVQCNIARCYEMKGAYDKAAEHYRRCLDEGARGSPAEGEVKRSLQEVEQRVQKAEQQPEGEPAAPRQPTVIPGRPFVVSFGLGPAIQLSKHASQLKLAAGFGYHFNKTASGPALGFDLQVSVQSDFATIELGPKFFWDIPIVRSIGLYLAPSGMLGFAHVTERCHARSSICDKSRSGLTVQLGVEGKLLLADRVIVTLRPFTIDLLPTSADEWTIGVRYDLILGAGVIF